MKTESMFRKATLVAAVAASLSGGVSAQEQTEQRAASALLEEVVVTARKRAESAQDVPISVSAFNDDQINALKVRNLTNLAVAMPNVVLDVIGTARGYANFAIRGLGINSSIPSIDPAVGIVVDGVYLGTNGGVVFDTLPMNPRRLVSLA